jgi:hypothetical protein
VTTIVGGVYAERCVEPFWDDVYGSGGRAAAALSAALPGLQLQTYRAKPVADGILNLTSVYGIAIDGPEIADAIAFDYVHSLATPRIHPRPDAIARHAPIIVHDDIVLRFGMLEGDAQVAAKRAVYDPQSAFDPRAFAENGSTADELALVLNRLEARCLTGETDPHSAVDKLHGLHGAQIVILKMGGHGALVSWPGGRQSVPAYRSASVWKIGSGDVFSAAFTLFWAVEGRDPIEAADLASRATSYYCGSRGLPILTAEELVGVNALPARPGHGTVYLAAPFFNLGERWIVEEARSQLLHMGVNLFSPLHEVGPGPADYVAPLDLAGLDQADVVLAVLSGSDVGTVFEVGYAVARGKPVVALAQNMRAEDLKMIYGSGCHVVEDLVSAIYHAVWRLP